MRDDSQAWVLLHPSFHYCSHWQRSPWDIPSFQCSCAVVNAWELVKCLSSFWGLGLHSFLPWILLTGLEKPTNWERLMLQCVECICWHLSGEFCRRTSHTWDHESHLKRHLGLTVVFLPWNVVVRMLSLWPSAYFWNLDHILCDGEPLGSQNRVCFQSASDTPFLTMDKQSLLKLHTGKFLEWMHWLFCGRDVVFKSFHSLEVNRITSL